MEQLSVRTIQRPTLSLRHVRQVNWIQSGIRLALLKGYILKYYKYYNLNLKSLEVVRYSVVQQCGLRPLNVANSSHKHVVQYCSPWLLCQCIKPLNTNSEKV